MLKQLGPEHGSVAKMTLSGVKIEVGVHHGKNEPTLYLLVDDMAEPVYFTSTEGNLLTAAVQAAQSVIREKC